MQVASVRWAVQRRSRVATLWVYDASLQSNVRIFHLNVVFHFQVNRIVNKKKKTTMFQ